MSGITRRTQPSSQWRPRWWLTAEMALLSEDHEDADRLRILAAQRREMPVELRTPVPLLTGPRRGGPADEIARMKDDVRQQLSALMKQPGYHAFSEPVALAIELQTPASPNPPGLRRVLKSYIDALAELILNDDRDIHHLIVRRVPCSGDAQVTATVLPLDLFEADYDRAFRLLGHDGALATVLPGFDLTTATMRDGAPIPSTELPPWGLLPFTSYDRELMRHHRKTLAVLVDLDDSATAQLDEDSTGTGYLDVPSSYPEFADPDIRERTRKFLEDEVAHALGRQLTDQGFDARDRTGAVTWLRELDPDVDVLQLDDDGAGSFVVEPPTDSSPAAYRPWAKAVKTVAEKAVKTGAWREAEFGGNIVLDIAVPTDLKAADLDNVAGYIFSGIHEALGSRAEHLVGYRAYRQERGGSVRVRLLPEVRLTALQNAMKVARLGGLMPSRSNSSGHPKPR